MSQTTETKQQRPTDNPLQTLSYMLEEAARMKDKLAAAPVMSRHELQGHLADTVLGLVVQLGDLLGATIYSLAQDVEHLGARIDSSDESYITTVEELLTDAYALLRDICALGALPEQLKERCDAIMSNINTVVSDSDDEIASDENAAAVETSPQDAPNETTNHETKISEAKDGESQRSATT